MTQQLSELDEMTYRRREPPTSHTREVARALSLEVLGRSTYRVTSKTASAAVRQDRTPAPETSRQKFPKPPSPLHSTANKPSQCSQGALYVMRGLSRTATRPPSSLPSPPRQLRSPHARVPPKPNNRSPRSSHLGAPSLANTMSPYEMLPQRRRSQQLALHRHNNRNSHGTTSSHSAEHAEESGRDALSWAQLLSPTTASRQ